MGHITNAKQRSQAFFKFMVFFLVTIVIVVTAVYFDYDLPHKDNTMLRTSVVHYQKDSMVQQEFITSLEEIKNLIDSLGKPKVDNDYFLSLINDKLTKSSAFQNQSSNGQARLKRFMLDVFLSFKNAKKGKHCFR